MPSTQTEITQKQNVEDKRKTLFDKCLGLVIKTVFVLGSSALVLDSARNSWTWYLSKIWGDAGSAWQDIWSNILTVVLL